MSTVCVDPQFVLILSYSAWMAACAVVPALASAMAAVHMVAGDDGKH
jgi:hypothetical protein